MGDPFTDVSVSGYNSNPPTDDGSQTEANRVKWATIKEKLPDPLKAALESLVTNVGAAFDKVSGGFVTTGISYQVASTDQGKLVRASAASITITTPDATDVGAPFCFGVVNDSTGDITLDGSGSQTINGNASVTIPKTRGVFLYTNGANWFAAGLNWHTEIRPAPFSTPKGRLTLTTAVPVLQTDTSGITTVFYTPYQGNTILLPDANGDWAMTEFSEVSQTLADNTKSPAAALADNLYDIFGWLDGSTFRATRGPAWTSATARGTGAGTTELTRLDGVLVNAVAISNGPGASRGVYLGTIATNGSNQLGMNFTTIGAGGGANRLDVWNMYNRVLVSAISRDSTDSWAYTTATLRSANNSTSNRVTLVCGQNEDIVTALYSVLAQNNAAAARDLRTAIGLDSTSAASGSSLAGMAASRDSSRYQLVATFSGQIGLGRHFLQALEYAEASGTATWYGDNADSATTQMGLCVRALM